MNNTKEDKFKQIEMLLKDYEMYGANVPVYYDKGQSCLTKDRIAASFISDIALKEEAGFTNTIIKAFEVTGNKEVTFESNMVLSYEAIISLIYELRISGYNVSSIMNISTGPEKQVISVDELHTDTDIVKVSVGDRLRGLVDNLIKEHRYRDGERHTSKIVKFKIDKKMLNLIALALNKSYTKIAAFSVISDNGDDYYIFDGLNITCIVQKNHMIFVSTNRGIDLKGFISNLDNEGYKGKDKNGIEVTNEIIML